VGQLIRKSDARVVPVFFDGQNSAWLQTASHISQHLQTHVVRLPQYLPSQTHDLV
jgi:putative hemolysin